MTDTKPSVAADPRRFEQAYASCAAELAALREEDLVDPDIEVFDVVVTVMFALPLLRELSPLITQIKGVDRARLQSLQRYAYAAAYIDFCIRARDDEDVAALHDTARTYQDALCATANVLAPDPIPLDASARALDTISGDLARRAARVLALCAPRLPEEKQLEGAYRTAIEAEFHAELLAACLRPATDTSLEQLEDQRTRTLSLLASAYEPASAAARSLSKQDQSEIDALAMSYAYGQVVEAFGPEALRFFEPGGEGGPSN